MKMKYSVLFKQQQKFPHTTHITKGKEGIRGGEGKGREKERRGEIK